MDYYEPTFVSNMRKNLGLMLVGFIVLLILFKFIGYSEIFRTIGLINVWFILLMIGTKAASLLIFTFKTYVLSKNIKPIKFSTLLPIHLAGALLNNLTPGPSVGGEPLKAYYLEKATGIRGSICFGLYTMDSLVFMAGSAFFMTLSTFYLIFSIGFERLRIILAIWFGLLLIISILVLLFIFKISQQKKRFVKYLSKFYKFPLFNRFLKKYFKTVEAFVKTILSKQRAFMKTLKHLWIDKKTLFKVFFASILWYPLQSLGIWFLFKGLGFEILFIRLLAVVTVSISLGFIIFVPGGTGAVEGAIILLMTMLGVPASAITAVIILDRAAYYVMTYFFGYLALSYVSMIYTSHERMYKRLGKEV